MPLMDTSDGWQSCYFSTTNILKINQFPKKKESKTAMSDCVVLIFRSTAEYFKSGSLSKSNIYCQHKRYDSYNAIKWYLFLFAAAVQTKRNSFVLSQWDIKAKLIRWHAGQNKHFFLCCRWQPFIFWGFQSLPVHWQWEKINCSLYPLICTITCVNVLLC